MFIHRDHTMRANLHHIGLAQTSHALRKLVTLHPQRIDIRHRRLVIRIADQRAHNIAIRHESDSMMMLIEHRNARRAVSHNHHKRIVSAVGGGDSIHITLHRISKRRLTGMLQILFARFGNLNAGSRGRLRLSLNPSKRKRSNKAQHIHHERDTARDIEARSRTDCNRLARRLMSGGHRRQNPNKHG